MLFFVVAVSPETDIMCYPIKEGDSSGDAYFR